MKNILTLAVLLISLSVVVLAGDGDKYGGDITLTEKTRVSAILENPAAFEGKKVLIEGIVVGVCKERGCWIDIASDTESKKIRVKVDDGVITFPIEAAGKKALVEGTVYSIDSQIGCAGEEAGCSSEKKESGDSCCPKTKASKIYQIKGIGAVIE
jgi:hypothetical protein